MRMDVSRRGFAPKRQIRCQEDLFYAEDIIYFAVQIDQLRARALARCNTVRYAPLPTVHPYPCGSNPTARFSACPPSIFVCSFMLPFLSFVPAS